MTNWKDDKRITHCEVESVNNQLKKKIEYEKFYKKEVLDSDPIRDWESIDRCIKLWEFFLKEIKKDFTGKTVLDCGTKDGQFVTYLTKNKINCIGMEISEEYVTYARNKGRNVEYGDVCNIEYKDESFDVVFSHHLLGLTSDYFKGLSEMFRVTKKNGYLVTLNDVPGNSKKHYSYVKSTDSYFEWLKREELNPHKIIYHGRNPYLNYPSEWILILQKI